MNVGLQDGTARRVRARVFSVPYTSADPSVGSSTRMYFYWAHGRLDTCAWPCICAHACACSSQIHRDDVKDCVSYRCKPRTSGWHISKAQKGRRGGAKPQWRAVPQSLNSGGVGGGERARTAPPQHTPAPCTSDCPHTSIHPL